MAVAEWQNDSGRMAEWQKGKPFPPFYNPVVL
jgi:hypothetical protein